MTAQPGRRQGGMPSDLMAVRRKLPMLSDISHSKLNVLWVRECLVMKIRDEQVNYTSLTASPGVLIRMIREVCAAVLLFSM